jgi:uncharacterized membrane protein YeiH
MDLQYGLELVGTFVFAISGALAIREKDHDLFGAGFTGFITAIGGGTLRDILLNSYPLVWVGNVQVLYAIFAGILMAFIFPNFLSRLRKTYFLFEIFFKALLHHPSHIWSESQTVSVPSLHVSLYNG